MKARGFTLIEVMVALAILAISLTVLLSTQAASMRNAGKVRDLTVATLLARSKMIDIERDLFDEGFTAGDQEEDGDFSDEGYADFKWRAKITEVELTLETIEDMAGGFDDGEDRSGDSGEEILGFIAPLEGVMGELGNSVRFVELEITWPLGADGKYKDKMAVSALVTREDFGIQPEQILQEALERGGGSSESAGQKRNPR